MSVNSFPNNKDEFVGCEPLMKFLHGRTSGVFAADGNARVSATSPASMAVNVSDGIGWISNEDGDGAAWWIDTNEQTGSELSVPVDTAGAALPRIDRVVLTWPTINYVSPPEISIIKGKEASSPTPPALTNNGTVRQISLARILIPAGALSITSDMIYDERLDPAVCGLVTNDMKLDTAGIYAQLNAMLEKLQNDIQAVKKNAAYVFKSGDTMTGPLKVPTPVAGEDAVPKAFLEQSIREAVQSVTVSLPVSGWFEEKQTVPVPGFKAGDNGIYGPSGTKQNVEVYSDSRIFVVEEKEGQVVFGYVDKPSSDLSVDIIFHAGR